MEKTGKKAAAIGEFFILVLVIVCVALVVLNLSQHLSDTVKAKKAKAEIAVAHPKQEEVPPPLPSYDELMELISRGD